MKTKELTYCAIILSVIIILGFFPPIPIGILPVPIVIQNAGFMLAGLVLGKRNATIVALLFLALVALGFPILPSGRGGIAVFFGISVGYLISYPFASFLIGWLNERLNPQNKNVWVAFGITFFFGVVGINLCGALGISLVSDLSFPRSLVANLVFLPGDTIKAFLSAFLAQKLLLIKSDYNKNLWG